MSASTPEANPISQTTATSSTQHPLRTAIRHSWAGVLAGLLLGLTVGAVAPFLLPHTYTSTASVFVAPTGVDDQVTILNARTSGPINMDNEAQIVRSAGVVAIVRARDSHVSKKLSDNALESPVSVAVPANTSILQISYTASSAAAAARLANDFASAYLENRAATAQATLNNQIDTINARIGAANAKINGLSAQLASGKLSSAQKYLLGARRSLLLNQVKALNSQVTAVAATAVGSGRVLTDAVPPATASSPSRSLWLAGGFAAGVVIALCVLYVNTSARRILISPEDVTSALRIPVIERIPDASSGQSMSPSAREHYRRLANVVARTLGADGILVLTTPGFDGLSSAAALNLAEAMNIAGMKARVVATAAAGHLVAEQRSFVAGAASSGPIPTTPAGVAELRALGGITIVAGREPGSAADVQAAAALADAVLLVMPSRIPRREATELLALLDAVAAPILGAVSVPRQRAWRHPVPDSAAARTGGSQSSTRARRNVRLQGSDDVTSSDRAVGNGEDGEKGVRKPFTPTRNPTARSVRGNGESEGTPGRRSADKRRRP